MNARAPDSTAGKRGAAVRGLRESLILRVATEATAVVLVACSTHAQAIRLDPVPLPAAEPAGPSLWFSASDLPAVRARVGDPALATYLSSFRGAVDGNLATLASNPTSVSDDALAKVAKGAALLHQLGETPPSSFATYGEAAVAALRNLGPRSPQGLTTPPDVVDVLQDSGRLQSMAEAFDMLRGTGAVGPADDAPIRAILADWADALRDDINLAGWPFPPIPGHRDNWGIKGGAALVTTALAIPAHAGAPTWLSFGQRLLNESLARVTSPTGWYREGPHYLNYSFNNLASTCWHVRRATGLEWFDDIAPLVRASIDMRQPDGSAAPFEDGVPNAFPHDVLAAAIPALGPVMTWAWAASSRDPVNYDNQQLHDATRFLVVDPAIAATPPAWQPTRFLAEDANVHALRSLWDPGAVQATMITAVDHDDSTTFDSRHHVQNPLDLCLFARGSMLLVTASGGPEVTRSANRAEYLNPRSKGSPLVGGSAPFVTDAADVVSSSRTDAHDSAGLPNHWADLASTAVTAYAGADRVTRTLALLDERLLLVADEMTASVARDHELTWRGRGTRAVLLDAPDLQRISWTNGPDALDLAAVSNAPHSLLLRDSFYAPAWGVEEVVQAAHLAVTTTDSRRLSLLVPRGAGDPPLSVAALSASGVAAMRFDEAATATLAALGPRGAAWSADAVTRADAALVAVREDAGMLAALAVTDATTVEVRGVPVLSATAPVTLVLTVSPGAFVAELSQDQAGSVDVTFSGLPGIAWSSPLDVTWNAAPAPEASLRRTAIGLEVLGLGSGGTLVVRGSPASLGDVGATLRLSGDELRWGAATLATGYKVRRSLSPDFIRTNPPPDDTDLIATPATTSWIDSGRPGPGGIFFYFVNAVAPPLESTD